jgi:HSP20 family molecular chaperone IbpA
MMTFDNFTTPVAPDYGRADFYVTDNCIEAIFDIPGVDEEDIELTFEAPYLILSINARKPVVGDPLIQERVTGACTRRFKLTSKVDVTKATYTLARGEMLLCIPFHTEARPVQIPRVS